MHHALIPIHEDFLGDGTTIPDELWEAHGFFCYSKHVWVLSCFSRVLLFVTPWTVGHQAPLSMGFSRQEYWSGLPCPASHTSGQPGSLPLAQAGEPLLQFSFLTCLEFPSSGLFHISDPQLAWHPFAAATKSLQLCPTLCDPIDGSPPGSPIPGILQARTLEWVAISFSNAWKWKWSRSVLSDS